MLALQNESIPPHLHLKEVNPYLSLEDSRLEIGTYLRPWKRRDQPRFAGVSSFGFGGTNAHIILSDAPQVAVETNIREIERPRHILTLSAKTESALSELAQLTSEHLTNTQHSLTDISYTANTSRSHFEHRLAIQASSIEELKDGSMLSCQHRHLLSTGHANGAAKSCISFHRTRLAIRWHGTPACMKHNPSSALRSINARRFSNPF